MPGVILPWAMSVSRRAASTDSVLRPQFRAWSSGFNLNWVTQFYYINTPTPITFTTSTISTTITTSLITSTTISTILTPSPPPSPPLLEGAAKPLGFSPGAGTC
jgi:hypothetical protein